MNNPVSVYLWGKEICRLEWKGGYKQGFGKLGAVVSFSKDYCDCPWDLDPLGPFNKNSYIVKQGLSDWCRASEYEGVPRFISSSLPDSWGNAVFAAWASNNKLHHRDITAVDKLSYIGKRGMGALEFFPSALKASPKDTVILENLYLIAKAIQQQRENFTINLNTNPGVEDLIKVGMSAGGMHPKAIIAINWKTGEVKSGQVEQSEDFKQYIIKFKDSETWPTAEIEYAYYLMASECGIEMMPCQLIDIQGENHFLTQRFDRTDCEKIHTATLNSLNGPTNSYEEIFAVARRLLVPHRDLVQLYKRAVFNYMAGVCDDHDKNFSFIMRHDGQWRLSPAYDVTFTINLKNPFIGDRHSMTLGGKDCGVDSNDFIKLAETNDIRGPKSIIQQTSESLKTFVALSEKLKINKDIAKAVTSLILPK